MQYYRLLAKEVEKRIAVLKQYVYDTGSDSEDKIDAPKLLENEQTYEQTQNESKNAVMPPNNNQNDDSNIAEKGRSPSPKYFIDLNLTINETNTENLKIDHKSVSPVEVPERDYECVKRYTKQVTHKEIITKVEAARTVTKKPSDYRSSSAPVTEDPLSPSSLGSMRFSGSLNNIHTESSHSNTKNNNLTRQSSYTLLYPSPQLLAHLEIHAQSTGIDMSSISMSESLSNISSPGKKRRSWDLESAKAKWSNMALELKQKSVISTICAVATKSATAPAQSVEPTANNRNKVVSKALPKSEPLTGKKSFTKNHATNRSLGHQPTSPKSNQQPVKPTATPVPAVANPATRVRELYDKIQRQQLVQMESLVEKQKKEQLLLQQVFEEQNNMLFNQLKTICPKSPIEAKKAWDDKHCEGDQGPVSLSQLINCKPPTLTDTNKCLTHCDNVLKQSRNITGSLKKEQPTSHGTKVPTPTRQSDRSVTRPHSPVRNPTSRKLNYDTSASSDREYEPILTDRTNDTMADLNVTFPSDNSDEYNSNLQNNNVSPQNGKGTKFSYGSSLHTNSGIPSRISDKTNKNASRSVNNANQNSSTRASRLMKYKQTPNPRERDAATKIVAHAKGYLVRRLMRTERVQGIVQTIKDALLCALQLHQDREGIRGADVDLHRRLIQQITAACYTLHDTFVTSTPAERCAMISTDRSKRNSLANRTPISFRQTDIMTQSHSGSFPARSKRQQSSLMTQSNYEAFSGEKSSPVSRRYMPSPRSRPWR